MARINLEGPNSVLNTKNIPSVFLTDSERNVSFVVDTWLLKEK